MRFQRLLGKGMILMGSSNLERCALAFFEEKKAMGYTYKSEEYTIRNFIHHCSKDKTIIDKRIHKELIISWAMKRKNEKNITHKSRILIINRFLKYLLRHEWEVSLITIKYSKVSEFKPIILSSEEIASIFIALDTLPIYPGTNAHIDYPIMFRILFGCGLRVSELIDLKIKDYDRERQLFIVRNPKNKRDKLIPLSKSLFTIVDKYYLEFNVNKNVELYFFRSKLRKHYARNTVSEKWRNLLLTAGVSHDSELGPRLHDIRHIFCCLSLRQLIDKGMDSYVSLPYLSIYVGHSSTKATEKYLHLSQFNYEDINTKLVQTYGKVIPNE